MPSFDEPQPPRNGGSPAGASAEIRRLLESVNEVFFGKPQVVRLTVATLLARGHLLIEDVPGVGKTLLGIALARSIDASFRRIQFTNDLLPSDIVGVSVFDPERKAFEFKPGPIFSNILLADEINRTTPKTQSALLESMNDFQVTVDGETRPLPAPFLVLATQNPVEYHGTFPLPEAQLDRFLMRVRVGYPDPEDEKRILREKGLHMRAEDIPTVMPSRRVLELQRAAERVRVDEAIHDYVVRIAEASRRAEGVRLGMSPRGSLALCRAAQAYALTDGRDYCEPDDIKAVAVPALSHRIVLESGLSGLARVEEEEAAVRAILDAVPVPA